MVRKGFALMLLLSATGIASFLRWMTVYTPEAAHPAVQGGNIPKAAVTHDWCACFVQGDADRMRVVRQRGLAVAMAFFAAALICAVYLIAARKASGDINAAADRQLRIIALDLESALEKFETLPYTLSFHPDVVHALLRPDPSVNSRLNLALQAIQQHSKVAAIYLMDREGNTLASSNWDQTLSFVGKNFRFRPYFIEAIAGRAGRFYGIGNTTGEPGYFIAQPVYPLELPRKGSAPIGVIAVKISLVEFERAWHSSEEPIALADRSGVVFLSNREPWKYHSLRPLDEQARRDLADTLQYAGQAIQPLSALPKKEGAGFGEFVARPVGRLEWQLMLFPSQTRVMRVAGYSAASRIPDGTSGKVQITVVPRFSPVSMRTVPPCSSTKLLTMERPRPAPRRRPPLARGSKRLNTVSSTSGAMPGPSSCTENSTPAATWRQTSVTVLPSGA